MKGARGAWLPCALLTAAPAFGAGGAHVVDDAAVETPGDCHVETWVSATSDGGLVNVTPGCTRTAWPNLEMGGLVTHGWSAGEQDTVAGLSSKLVLRPEQRGLGIGLSGSLGFGLDRGRFETASLIMPLTIPAGHILRFNVDAGWQWSRATDAHDLFAGGQVEIRISAGLGLMAETFGRSRGKMGGQTGLRWTVAGGRVDLDLLAGRYLDGATPNAVTFGVTVRR
ncbi:hypothetical protein [Sphingobium nicotianae]|uniref:Outer membrane protein beta-barrel domain-containing protein n=1 Tax=Sphingobium nicotianae TaxID=2782607 RepID=A0A9X1DDB0_9SPHN|nr:hypothetical protein [Sphingobium nicotianae]MBT2187822.1 hypothetical protein [Sphingobium nicotianae]